MSTAFVMIRSTNPHREGAYTRAGFRFGRSWRGLQVAAGAKELDDPSKDIVSAQTLEERLEKDEFLAVKPATSGDIEAFKAEQAAANTDKDAELAELRKKNADLEARMMRLEAAAGGKVKGGAKSDDKADDDKK